MAVYYLDGTNLSNSTAVYDDEDLTVCSADGYYSNGGIVRQLVNCVLQSQQTCTGSLSCPIAYTVCYSNVSAAELCCRNRTEKTIYISNDYTFDNAPRFYDDEALTTISATGWYSDDILGGCVAPVPTVPCGQGISAAVSGNGSFVADIDLANDTGAVILYFWMGSTIPDGVLATYNSNTFNRLTCQGNKQSSVIVDGSSTAVDYAGINNQGTGLVTYVGNDNSNLLIHSPYNNTPSGTCTSGDKPQNYTYDGTSYLAQGTYSTVTVVSDQIGVNPTGSQVFTMVVPKTTATPEILNLLVSAPMCGTVFRWSASCPVDLPSFTASVIQSTTTCAAATTTYYFARNATGTNIPFVIDTNTIPNIGNWVFEDANGSSYLNDTNTIQYYIIATTAFGVRNGVVVSSAACT